MIETVETIKDVEKALSQAKAKLQAFEDSVDRARLLKRLKLASPAHPVLLFRVMFLLMSLTSLVCIVGVLVVPMVNADWARTLAKFDAVVPAPPGIPGLPALLGLLFLCMIIGYGMTTMAALAMGRDAQMLPWEQKQHQKLVNEVTRLTTQKAVMERMRSTPAGARPRMETPVPVSLRERGGLQTPSALGRLGESNPGGPPRLGEMKPGRFGQAPGGNSSNPFGRAPGSAAPAATPAGAAGAGLFTRAPTPSGAPASSGPGYSAPAATGGGVLARARSGALKTTPAGAAGRLTPSFNRPTGAPGPVPDEEGGTDSSPFGDSGGSAAKTAPSNPFGSGSGSGGLAAGGSNPFSSSNPFGGGGLSDAGGDEPSSPFGTRPSDGLSGAPAAPDLPSIVDSSSAYSSQSAADSGEDSGTEAFAHNVSLPTWGAIDDPWLEEALERVEDLARGLPMQAHISFSEESFLPFTLVIARATPAVAVKALVSYVEFLSTIPTPPRARIELNASPGLDRSFHRNVEAALQPIYDDQFQVDLEPGRVEVNFTAPDAAWEDHPVLPMA